MARKHTNAKNTDEYASEKWKAAMRHGAQENEVSHRVIGLDLDGQPRRNTLATMR